jgi:FkbM family methyltransferase
MRNVNYHSRFTRMLTSKRVFKDFPLSVLDVGARGGPQSHWPLYGQDVRVIGFEPHAEECQKLNETADSFQVPFICHPVGLGKENFTARLYDYPNQAANSLIPPENVSNPTFSDITITRFEDFAKAHHISQVDFIKMDIERHEMEALEGMQKWLGGDNPVFGFEIEVHFRPQGDTPLYSDIELFLRKQGYRVADLDIFKASNPVLPAPVAWDHRNHLGEPILGPTTTGEMVHGDALFFIDLNRCDKEKMRAKGPVNLLKYASLFEVYGLSDCAAELLLEYRKEIEEVLSVDEALDALVPNHFGEGLSYHQYLQAYEKRVGRPSLVNTASREAKTLTYRIVRRIKRMAA